MICKNCANIFDDDYSCCPECGTPIRGSHDASKKINADAYEDVISFVLSQYNSETKQSEEPSDNNEASQEASEETFGDFTTENFEEDEALQQEEPEEEAVAENEYNEQPEAEPENEEEVSLSDYQIERSGENADDSIIDEVEAFTEFDEYGEFDEVNEELEAQAESEAYEEADSDEGEELEQETEEANGEADDSSNDAEQPKQIKKIKSNETSKPIAPRSEWKEPSKKEKKAMNVIVITTVLMFALMGILTAVSIFTDVFEQDPSTVKTVALSGLSAEETEKLETYLSNIAVVAYDEFDSEKADLGDFINYFNPSDSGGLYCKFYGAGELTVNSPDPAQRFANENGDYSYYVVNESYIDNVITAFGFEADHSINEKDCYYYNGNYYFKNDSALYTGSERIAQVDSTKRIDNGYYYAECRFYDENSQSENMDYLEAFIVFNMADEGDSAWEIIEISHEPVFDDMGVQVSDKDATALSYEMRTEKIENTDGEKVVAVCSIKYPYFTGTTLAENVANQLYAKTIEAYKSNPKSIKEDIKICATVTYNKNGYLSIIEETTSGTGTLKESEDAEGESTFVFPVKAVEGYTIEIETGDILIKSDIISKEYQIVEQILYRIYNGYDYSELLKEDSSVSESIPEDEDEIGRAIYESANAMSEDGYVFCYVTDDGYMEKIVLPYTIENFFTGEY